ncbi:MAG: hypothetical protein A3H42_04865 [Deltaproteobacteria bacterium RIFCSPLOWO2_02_FULL_46_8]|nr:MAG: hypothetical protein A3H42_04865 [Deltaproteobacteria bacterium RIFCSPLOWO2_02_FULL_46_8]
MTIHFDPKAKALAINTPAPAKADVLEEQDSTIIPHRAVSEMDLLFSGLQQQKQLQSTQPADVPEIPDFEKDILGPMPILGKSSITTNGVISRYLSLRKNLLERRNSLSIALEGHLKPEEAYDVFSRIDALDSALKTLQHNLDKAYQADREIRDREIEAKLRSSQEE